MYLIYSDSVMLTHIYTALTESFQCFTINQLMGVFK